MWQREHESQKPINFAAVTGGSNAQSQVAQNMFSNEPPPQVDASKAPGYRGGAVCSPVSSKTSSNSTTPPNISSAISYQTFPDQPVKTQNLAPIGSLPHGRPQVSSQSGANDMHDFFAKNNGPIGNVPLLNSSGGNADHFQAYMPPMNFSQPQQQSNLQSVTVSRLNPKAPDFSASYNSSLPPNKPNSSQHLFNGFPMNQSQNNNMYQMSKISQDQYSGRSLRLMQQVQQSNFYLPPPPPDIISGMAGMTIQNLARVAGSEIHIENGGDIGMVSPIMSPGLNHPTVLMNEPSFVEDRKPPQPIGTERARKSAYGGGGGGTGGGIQPPNLDHQWSAGGMLSGDNKRWMHDQQFIRQGITFDDMSSVMDFSVS